MYKKLNPITRLQSEMLTDGFRDGGLSLDSDCRFHTPPLHILQCNTAIAWVSSGAAQLQNDAAKQADADSVNMPEVCTLSPRAMIWPIFQCSLPTSQERHVLAHS